MGMYSLRTATSWAPALYAGMWPTFHGVPVHDAAACLLRLLMQHAGPESSMPPLC